jgi:hypothetical protein
LVTDLVGSTELRVRLGEDRAEVLRRTHDRLLADAIAANDGEVIKGLGDGVFALFAGAAEAVSAAIAVQQSLATHNDRHPEEALSVRVGLSAGDVTLEDDDCFGTPVVEASRLCADAAGGQILVADLVRMLARGRGGHEFIPLGERELKGLPAPVPLAEVRWERVRTAVAPMPPALATGQWFAFAGRVNEREALYTHWKQALTGERTLVLVSGEPGIGKTRLVAEVASHAHEDGAVVLYGRSEEELDTPYRPFTEALRHLAAHIPSEIIDAHVAVWGGEIGRLVPGLDLPQPPRLEGDIERLRLFDAVVDLIARASEEAPVLLVLDDLHWADRSSLLLLRHLVRADFIGRLLVVGTYRDTDLARTHPLAGVLADLRREDAVDRIALDGLDDHEVETLLVARAGGAVEGDVADLAARVRAETVGNPFFIGEVLLHLVESGAIYRQDGRWRGDRGLIEQIGVPEGVREAVGRRLSALPDKTNDLLRAAAVVGAEFDAAVVGEVTDVALDDVVESIDEAVRRRLVVESGETLDRYRFAHALVRQTLTEELTTSRRVRLHHKVALALEARDAPAAELAYHFGEAASLADASKAVEYAAAAGAEANDRLAYEQALGFFGRALEAEELVTPPDPARRAELMLGLGMARNMVGDALAGRRDFVQAADLARTAGRPDLLARAAFEYGGTGAVWLEWGDTVGTDLLDEALHALPPEPSPLRVQCLSKRSMFHTLDPDPGERLRLATEAVQMAGELDDLLTQARAISGLHLALRGQGQPERQRELSEQLELLVDATGDETLRLGVIYGKVDAYFTSNDLGEMRAEMARSFGAADRLQAAWGRWIEASTIAHVALLDGRFDEVPALAERTKAVAAPFGDAGVGVANTHLADLCRFTGDDKGAAALHRKMAEDLPLLLLPWPLRALAAWEDGDDDAARQGLVAWHRHVFPVVPAEFRVEVAASVAQLTASLAEKEIAADLYDVLLPQSGLWATFSCQISAGLVDHALGLLAGCLGRENDAVDRLCTAIDDYRRAETPPWLAFALIDLAELTGNAGAFAEAETLATTLGMAGVVRRVEALAEHTKEFRE